MARPRRIDPLVVKRAPLTAATAPSVESLRQCPAVLLPALFGATLKQTATVLGVGRATVARLQAAFRKPPSAWPNPARNWGGRRQSLPTPAEAGAFLKPWRASAATGNLAVVSPMRAALAQRPVVSNGYEREFQCVYGAVRPQAGELDWMICPAMNTGPMGKFLAQVSVAHAQDCIVRVVDGASLHVAKALVVPENIRLHRLPADAPELNPQEHLGDERREQEFPNRVFSDMAGVVRTLETGLPRLAPDRDRVRSICAWPWIVSLNLIAN